MGRPQDAAIGKRDGQHAPDQTEFCRIIFQELSSGVIVESSRDAHIGVIQKLADQGAEDVVLAAERSYADDVIDSVDTPKIGRRLRCAQRHAGGPPAA